MSATGLEMSSFPAGVCFVPKENKQSSYFRFHI